MWSRILLAALPYILAIGIAGGLVYKVYDYGYDRAWEKQELRYSEMIRKEEQRQAENIRKTRDLELQLRELESKLDDEASRDPNANRPALGIDGVRRLNRIGQTP